MRKGIGKWFTIGLVLVLIMGMSACGKDTSVVDKIAADQKKTAAESEKTIEQEKTAAESEKTTEQEKAAAQTTMGAENALNNPSNDTQKAAKAETGGEAAAAKASSGEVISPEDLSSGAGENTGMVEGGTEKTAKGKAGEGKSESGIDVDLTKLSSTMVYSEVYNMMSKPEDYVGKTIKIEGAYFASYWKETGKYYHCVLISDATACCQNGIEFVWDNGTHVYPDEYPPDDTVIELTGVFGLYEEDGQSYCYLKTDDITVR